MARVPDIDEEERRSRKVTEWLLALEEDPENRDVRVRLKHWLAADPRNQAAWAETSHIFSLLGRINPIDVPERAGRGAAPTPKKRWPRLAVPALALAVVLVLAILPTLRAPLDGAPQTGTAETRQLTLDDGSILHLGPASAATVAITATERRVMLLQGEALFTVVADPRRPFRVDVRDVAITVVGTVFDVHINVGSTDVAVQRGVVQVTHASCPRPNCEQLVAGHRIHIPVAGSPARSPIDPTLVGAWRDNQIVAFDSTVADVVADLRRRFQGFIVILDSDLAERRVTGIYDAGDPAEALKAIAYPHHARVRKVTPWLLLVSAS